MGKVKNILAILLLSCIFPIPSEAQFDGITFKDSIYVATFTHYFIPMTITNTDTFRLTNQERISSIEWTEDGRLLDLDSIRYEDGSLAYPHKFDESGTYSIGMEITDTSGVIYYTSKTIFVENTIDVPNVFSPDEDGINDVFIVKSSGDRKIKLEIYTRNGELIHKKIGPVVYWDGKLASGNYASQGVYYYIVKTENEPEIIKKGFFHLYR